MARTHKGVSLEEAELLVQGAGWMPRLERRQNGEGSLCRNRQRQCPSGTESFRRIFICFLMDFLIRGSLAFLIQALLDPARSSFLTQSASSRRQTSGQPRLDVCSLERKYY